MRIQWIIGCGVLVLATLAGCNKRSSPVPEPALSSEETKEINANEDALMGKRDALFTMRRDLQARREALAKERSVVRQRGGDTSEMDSKAKALLSEDKTLVKLEKEQSQAESKGRRVLMAALAAAGTDKAARVRGRETVIASREKELARRERELATREASLGRREEGLASKWKAECAVGAPQTIIRTIDLKGSNYSKKDVEPLLGKARRGMSKKGLLASDLPPQARGLESEANAAMKSGDYSRARLAASQLVSTIRGIKIDKAFIAAKIGRLNARMRGKTLGKKSESLFRDATAAYGDANFKKSNSKLNKLTAGL